MKRALLHAAWLVALSWLITWAALSLGRHFIVPGDGFPKAGEVQSDLFRFDSVYYQSIAETGYAYNGVPFSSPNIVFAPLFPLLISAVSAIPGLDTVSAGFAVNLILLWLSVALLFQALSDHLPERRRLLLLFALLTTAGSYSFRAYYSESTFLFGLSLLALAWERRRPGLLVLAAIWLGASRLAALPMVVGLAAGVLFLPRFESVRQRALIAVSGLAGSIAYLLYLGWKFGNPFTLLAEIQKSSWGRFHEDADWVQLLCGGYLFRHWEEALGRGWETLLNIQTLNLFWMTVAGITCVYLLIYRRDHLWTWIFIPYFLFIYHSNAASPYLISSHRLFAVMIPIFLLFDAGVIWLDKRSRGAAQTLAALLLLLNLAYGLLHTAMFNQGVWFWF